MALSSTSALTPSTSFSALSTKWQHLDSTANPGRSGAPSAADPRRSGFGGSEGKRVPNTLRRSEGAGVQEEGGAVNSRSPPTTPTRPLPRPPSMDSSSPVVRSSGVQGGSPAERFAALRARFHDPAKSLKTSAPLPTRPSLSASASAPSLSLRLPTTPSPRGLPPTPPPKSTTRPSSLSRAQAPLPNPPPTTSFRSIPRLELLLVPPQPESTLDASRRSTSSHASSRPHSFIPTPPEDAELDVLFSDMDWKGLLAAEAASHGKSLRNAHDDVFRRARRLVVEPPLMSSSSSSPIPPLRHSRSFSLASLRTRSPAATPPPVPALPSYLPTAAPRLPSPSRTSTRPLPPATSPPSHPEPSGPFPRTPPRHGSHSRNPSRTISPHDYPAPPSGTSSPRTSLPANGPFPTHIRRTSSASFSKPAPSPSPPPSTMNNIPEHRRAPSITSTRSLPAPRKLRSPRSPPLSPPTTTLYSHSRQPFSSSLRGLHLPPTDYQSSSIQPFPSSRASPFRTSGPFSTTLRPGPAVPNYFNLDFSFLDNEPPPGSSSRSSISERRSVSDTAPLRLQRPASIDSKRSRVPSSSGASIRSMRSVVPEDEAALEDMLFGGSRSTFSSNPPSPASPTFPRSVSTSSHPFPSRPPIGGRRTSSSSIASSLRDEPPSPSRPSSVSSRRTPIFSHRTSISSRPREEELRDPYSSSRAREEQSRRVSGSSSLSPTSSAASIVFRGSRAFTTGAELDSPTSSNFSTLQLGEEKLPEELLQERANVAEKRKRLALFLDETAAAMEGGKSLAMVLPTGEAEAALDGGMSLSEMAEAAASPVLFLTNSPLATPRLSSAHNNTAFAPSSSPVLPLSSRKRFQYATPRHPTEPLVGLFPISSVLNDTFHTADCGSAEVSPVLSCSRPPNSHRESTYFTPPLSGQSSTSDSEEELDAGINQAGDRGLGFDMDLKPHPGSFSRSERVPPSPATLRGVSPVPSLVSRETQEREAARSTREVERAAIEKQAEQIRQTNAKMAEKRRRTIEELVETEASYASDMAVVRDIFFARAKGADMASIADHVMSTGLGLGNILGGSPPSPILSSDATSKKNQRSPSLPRRISSQPSPPLVAAGEPLMSAKDLHVVFANLEEMADLAEAFAGVLDGARGSGNEQDMADRMGEVFVEMIPRIQQVYSTYCARHHRAILRLQELEPVLRTYLDECKTLSRGRTNAWDLASLLIKPVQRCLKYPLLLDQILAVTPKNHPDRNDLKRANTNMLMVAEHINEFKKRHDLVGRIVSKKESTPRSPSRSGTPVLGSTFGRSVTKKFLRSSQKAKVAIGIVYQEKDDMFDTLAALVDSSRSAVLRFSSEMRDWSRSTKSALDAQGTLIEGWIEVCAPQIGEARLVGGGHERLCVFLEQVLRPVIDGPWADLDYEIRRSLLVKTEHLLSLFENPRSVIAKRNDKLLDHSRYLAKKLSVDRRGSEEFLVLSAQLSIELPRFLSSVSRYFNIIIAHFATAQATYHEAVQVAWTAYADQWFVQIPAGPYAVIESSFASSHLPVAEMMDTLAAGLGAMPTPLKSPASHIRPTSIPQPTAATPFSNRPLSRQRFPPASGSGDFTANGSPQQSGTNRSSIASESSAPSFTMSNATSGSSNGTPATPPLSSTGITNGSKGFEQKERRAGGSTTALLLPSHDYLPPLPFPRVPSPERRTVSSPFPTSLARGVSSPSFEAEEEEEDTFDEEPSQGARRSSGRREGKKRESVYYEAEDVPAFEAEPVLYTAATMASARSNAFRSGYPILSFDIGELVQIELEEADNAEGGCGWLLGRKEDGQRGWCRTEDLHVVPEGWL